MVKYKLYDLNNNFLYETQSKKIMKEHTGFVESHNSRWCVNQGILHRIDGPAFEYYDGKQEIYYYINGEQIRCYSDEQFKLLIDMMKLKGLI